MMFTGTLIEDLIATVERTAQSHETAGQDFRVPDVWIAGDSTNYESKLPVWHESGVA
ncbi:MAG: hypothetical protein WAL71_10845 [Terriglobales bacterium]